MSVILFSAAELANAASYLTSSRFSSEQHLAQVIADLAAYSVGNAWAYNRQYGESVEPVSAMDLAGLVSRRFNREEARGTLRLLSYNGVTNAGAEIALVGYFEALARLMSGALGRVTADLEAATA